MSLDEAAASAAEERLSRLEAVTDAGLAHLDLEDLLEVLLERVRALLAVDTAAVLLLSPAGDELVATAALGIEEEVQQGVRIPLGKGFAGRIAAERRPVMIEEIGPTTVLNPLLIARGIRSMLGVPLLVGSDVLGVLHVGTLDTRRFTEDDVSLLQLVGDRIALATRARLSSAARTAAQALQRSLLPNTLPKVDGVRFAARYVPGEGEVGGDWYDVFAVPQGRICIVVGDVAGSGLPAAITMGRLRTVFRAHALDIADPADLLSKVDEHVGHFEPASMTTVLCAVLDPPPARPPVLRISAAGHPPPVLASPGERTRILDVEHDLPLGVDPTFPRHASDVALPDGAAVCFYTDGLVERRESNIDAGLDRLRRTMHAERADAVCNTVMSRLVGRDHAHDDIALLALSVDAADADEHHAPIALP